ncbi:hypothetical protein BN2497_9855 [Janthinobacterium sp. CG23_2]|nr:hypothetical protein BN2497_9855 [Janthinobacterium sp. CG23_2]CUU31325.1 hypothetical protein BN3177_9855 [Janthinobacterium sp. CG23_2]
MVEYAPFYASRFVQAFEITTLNIRITIPGEGRATSACLKLWRYGRANAGKFSVLPAGFHGFADHSRPDPAQWRIRHVGAGSGVGQTGAARQNGRRGP